VQTPSVPTCAGSVSTPHSVLEEVCVILHVAAMPKFLPCREKEFDNIYHFIEGKVQNGAGG
jgi:origin recognition complex subunit 1